MIHSDTELEVVKSILKLMTSKPFYGHVIQQFEKTYLPAENKEIETAAVGKTRDQKNIKFYINEGYVQKLLSDKQKGRSYVVSMIEHEILHVVLKHIFIEFSDHVRGNVACDICVNQYINPVNESWITHQKYNLPPGKSCYWYYDELKKNEQYQKDVKNGVYGQNGLMSYINSAHSKWGGTKGDQQCEQFVQDVMRKAREACNNQYGDIHGNIKEFLDELLAVAPPKIPWNRILRLFTSSASESNLRYTIQKVSKRYGTRPGTRLEEVLNLAVSIDTSGSISTEDLVDFFNEIRAIWKNGANVTIIEADSAVCRTYAFNGKFDGEVHGRGGTDLEPALKWVDEQAKFDAHVYFTDFYAPKIEKRYKTPVLWVITSDLEEEQHPYAWGKKVNIHDGKPI